MTSKNIIRSATVADQRPLYEMLKGNTCHRHLDWREPLGWIGSRSFLVLEQEGKLLGALTCPLDPAGAAWLRLFAHNGREVEETWKLLWEAASKMLPANTTVAAIAMQDWVAALLESSGFTIGQILVMLEKDGGDSGGASTLKREASIRRMLTHDLPSVAEADAASFAPLWQNSVADLARALDRAYLATVAEMDGNVIGYQISTRTSIGIHLARLAVRPETQGYGVGQALVQDLFSHAQRQGIQRFTVNTQGDNSVSRILYKKLGFQETGEEYPVYKFQIIQREEQNGKT